MNEECLSRGSPYGDYSARLNSCSETVDPLHPPQVHFQAQADIFCARQWRFEPHSGQVMNSLDRIVRGPLTLLMTCIPVNLSNAQQTPLPKVVPISNSPTRTSVGSTKQLLVHWTAGAYEFQSHFS